MLVASIFDITTVLKSTRTRDLRESVMSILDIVKEPPVLPGCDTTAPPQSKLSELQSTIVLLSEGVPLRVAIVFSAKLKQALLAPLMSKLDIVMTVPWPLP